MNFLKKIFSTEWRYGTSILYLAIFTSFSIIAYFHLSTGYSMSSDSFTYSIWADDLIKLDFNLLNYFKQNTYIRPNYIYTTPVIIIALFKLLFQSSWQFAFMILNLILVFFCLITFSKILTLLNVRALAIALSMPLITLSIDLLIWPRFILSDTIFAFLVLFAILIIVKSIVDEKIYYFVLITLIILMFLTRPTSVPYIFSIISFIIISRLKINYNPKLILLFIFSLSFFSPFILAVLHEFMKVYLISYSEVSNWIKQVEIGMIIHDRPETWVNKPNTFIEVVYLYFKRFIFFFNPYIKAFSKIHIILNLLQTLVLFVSLTVWYFLGNNLKLINKSIFVIVLVSISVAAFHSLTLIDYDWRYRFPLILPLLTIFPISLELIIKKYLH